MVSQRRQGWLLQPLTLGAQAREWRVRFKSLRPSPVLLSSSASPSTPPLWLLPLQHSRITAWKHVASSSFRTRLEFAVGTVAFTTQWPNE